MQATSSGLHLSAGTWLDCHFAACQAEYEAQVRSTGIQPGWRVLDAACGSGSFLPCLADLVGEAGRITALDLAPENVATATERTAGWSPACPIETRVGDVRDLPFLDGEFDAVWFANTSQYLDEDDLGATLREFQRVVRPGGLVAVKDSTGMEITYPSMRFMLPHLYEGVANADDDYGLQIRNVLFRTPALRRWLEQAGLDAVWQRSIVIERWSPLQAAEQQFIRDSISFWADLARRYRIPESNLAEWSCLSDGTSPDHPANHPAVAFREGNVLAVGVVPGSAA
jgi:SAM-dependent methyltransferase